MKKLLSFFVGILLSISLYSQSGDSCSTAKSFMPSQPVEPDETQIIQTQWFAFQAKDVQLRITLLNRVNMTSDKANKIFLWSGTCGSLTLLGSDTLSGAGDSVLSITVSGITTGTTYYLQVNKSTGTDTVHYFVERRYKLLDPTCTTCGLPPNPCELICNGSFESNSGDPTNLGGGEIDLVCAWDSPTLNSPDYYTPAGAGLYNSIGFNFAGLGPYSAQAGSDYVGGWAGTSVADFGSVNWHEYVYQKLRCGPLVAGITYKVSFWVIVSESYPGSVTDFGAWFTDAAHVSLYSTTTSAIPVVPQVLNATPISSSLAWTQVTGTFMASGTETYIVIGDFDSPAGNPAVSSYYLLDDVSLTPVANLTVSATPSTVCSGSSTTINFSDNLGIPLLWSPPAGLSCNNCSNPSLTGLGATTTFTGTVTVGCSGCTLIGSTTVTVDPVPTVNPLPNIKVCNGEIAGPYVFTGTPTGVTFSWTNSNPAIGLAASGVGNIPSFTATNPSTTTPITATITVTPSIGVCPGVPVSFIITVLPSPIIIVTPPSVTIILGGTATLTASGGASYLWSNGSTTDPLVVSPTSTTTYTVIGTNQYGCTSTASGTVTVINPNCSLIVPPANVIGTSSTSVTNISALYPSVNTISGQNFSVIGTLNIDKNFDFVDCRFQMESTLPTLTTNIKVINNSTLKFEQQTHLYGCPDMWDGIYVTPGCKIITTGDVMIEDAQKAIVIDDIAKGSITQTIFNRNLVAIKLNLNTLSASPVKITNSVFTSRSILTFPLPPTVAAVKTDLSLPTPTYFPAVLPPNPIGSQKGFAGIYATDVSNLVVGDATSTTDQNFFDAIMVGIDILNPTKPGTTSTIYNNRFQYLLGYGGFIACLPSCFTTHGYGILASGTNVTANNSITIGGPAANQANLFHNTYQAINIGNYETNTILNNSITNSSTGPFISSGGSPLDNYGNGGIFVAPAQNNFVTINNNAIIKNCLNAIWVNHGAGVTLSFFMQIDNNNIISDGIPAPTTHSAGAYCNNGIYVTDLLSPLPAALIWHINTNIIKETNNCIFLSNVKRPVTAPLAYSVFNNSCNTFYASTGLLTGIKTTGCKRISITQNHTDYTPGSMAYALPPVGNLTAYGLYLQSSQNMFVSCNLFERAGRSMVFSGNCASSTTTPGVGIIQNTMQQAQDGLVLLDHPAVIGQQGMLGAPSNNFWNMVTTPSFINQTNSISLSTNTASQLFVNPVTGGVSATQPTGNAGTGQYTAAGIILTSGTPAACSGTPPPALVTGASTMSPSDIAIYTGFLKTLEEDTTLLPEYSDETHWQRKKYVFDEVDDNPPYTVNPSLSSFYSTHLGSTFDKFSKVDRQINLGHYVIANAINNSITPVNFVESNQQTVNMQILQKLIDPTYVYSSSDTSTLYGIANQCPLQGGNGVYQARILLMTIADNVIEFIDNCDVQTQKSMQTMSTIPASVNEQSRLFKLYPNPNNGNMLLDYVLNANEKGAMIIYDMTGKLISRFELENANNQLSINNDQLNNGIYIYKIIINDKIVKSDKLVIIK